MGEYLRSEYTGCITGRYAVVFLLAGSKIR